MTSAAAPSTALLCVVVTTSFRCLHYQRAEGRADVSFHGISQDFLDQIGVGGSGPRNSIALEAILRPKEVMENGDFPGLVGVTRPLHIDFSGEEFNERIALVLNAPTRIKHSPELQMQKNK